MHPILCILSCASPLYIIHLYHPSLPIAFISIIHLYLSQLVVTLVIEPPFKPAALRYAWEDFPQCALFNAFGLPVAPFNITMP
jgi:hypothetical protein